MPGGNKMNTLSYFRSKNIKSYHWLCDESLANWIVEKMKPYGTSILDIGCGNGFMIPFYLNNFTNVAAIEPTPYLFEEVYKKYSNENITIKRASVEKIPFADNMFEVILAKSSLHHFKDVCKGIQEMCRVSKNAVAVMEVVAPDEKCIPFLREILLIKEKNRSDKTIFSLQSLYNLMTEQLPGYKVYPLLYDQYIDINDWLLYSDLSKETQQEVYEKILNSGDDIKLKLQVHFRYQKLVMLRRMCLCIGLKEQHL